MQKTIILFVLVLSWSCSPKLSVLVRPSEPIDNDTTGFITQITKNNISGSNYSIDKADLLIKNNGTTSKFIFSLKFEKPDKFLCSIKSVTGIEGARIFLSKDTILINDRINKKLLYGGPETLEKVTGIPWFCVNMALGDLLVNESNDKLKFERYQDELLLVQILRGRIIKSVLDRKNEKIKTVNFFSESADKVYTLEYSKYWKSDLHTPGAIRFNDHKRNIEARIRIRKLTTPWDGKIEFIPGNNYKKEAIR